MNYGRGGPNIVLICADMASARHFGCYDPQIGFTPNIDRLARDGALFDRAYCACPPCIPARVSMFTGQYAHTHGKSVHIKMPVPEGVALLPEVLSAAGYRSAVIGKTHWWPSDTDFGAEESYLTIDRHLSGELGDRDAYRSFLLSNGITDPGHTSAKELPIELLQASWTGDTTCDVIERFSRKPEPFFIFTSFVEPHGPGKTPDRYTNEIAGSYRPRRIDDGDYASTKPATQREAIGMWQRSEEQIDRHRLEVFAGIRLVDENIGKILSRLDSCGCLDLTLVVFLTDHGDLMYDHGCIEKTFLYDSAIRIPFLLRGPEIPAGRYPDLVSQIDLLPTILDYTGIAERREWRIEGRSVIPLFDGEQGDWRDTLYCESEQSVHLRGAVRSSSAKMALRWPWKYIYTLIDGHIVEEELYNLEDDPDERNNVVEASAIASALASALASIRNELKDEILRWLVATETSRLEPSQENHYPVPRIARTYL